MKNIPGLEITENSSSKRIIDIKIKEEDYQRISKFI
jgi:hypothetical protein